MRQVQSDRILMIPEILKRYENIHQEHLNSTWNRGMSPIKIEPKTLPKSPIQKPDPKITQITQNQFKNITQ